MVKKKIDSRIRTLVENGVNTKHRSMFVIVGDHGKEQVVNLHYMLSKAVVKARPTVLWCYKKDLGFSSHRKKRIGQIKKKIARGLLDPEKDDPFELFISSTDVRYTYYSDSHKILGNTFGMCVLQDFEALTPNLLARTIETVEGGGLIVLLLRTMSSLKQLYSMTMDVHQRFRTEAHQDICGRFNERFLLSLGDCLNCLVVDDQLNILPISSHALNLTPIGASTREESQTESERELQQLKASFVDIRPAEALVNPCRTLDQAKAVLSFIESISEKNLKSTVSLTASRGRGKSAALGLAIAAAVEYGYSNIFITSPTPENLKTLFEFLFRGFDALDYTEHVDYELIRSTHVGFNQAIVRVNVFKQHRQVIQYIQPQDHHKLGQAELVVIDEAAAIPLPLVQKLLGPYLVFMASTIHGYEGTGRSLSLKLISQLRRDCSGLSRSGASGGAREDEGAKTAENACSNRVLKELSLEEPIRYAEKDPIEAWLNHLLCLDSTLVSRIHSGCPSPDQCELYYINRDTLFSYHKASEAFLQRIMALYVSSHYKNSPNDLQLMSDAPAHHLFCLLGPLDANSSSLPEVLCVLQVCLEGEISKQSLEVHFSRGMKAAGDLIPWTLAQQFQDNDFGVLSGARIVRIATHPNYQRMGYGKRAIELLKRYYQGEISGLHEDGEQVGLEKDANGDDFPRQEGPDLMREVLQPRANLGSLLMRLSERKAERLHYLGVSYGLTEPLCKFWKRLGFSPVYLRQTPNELTGEHSCIMLYPLSSEDLPTCLSSHWLDSYWVDFRKRFLSLLGYQFRDFSPSLCMRLVEQPSLDGEKLAEREAVGGHVEICKDYTFHGELSPFDLKRLESYSKNLVDHHVIVDLLPLLARFWFLQRLPVKLSAIQTAMLLSLGLQHKTMDDLQKHFELPVSQMLALFNKCIRKLSQYLQGLYEEDVKRKHLPENGLQRSKEKMLQEKMVPLEMSLAEEVEIEATKISQQMKEKQQVLIKSLNLEQYAVAGGDQDWEDALDGRTIPSSISVKTHRPRTTSQPSDLPCEPLSGDSGKKRKHRSEGGSSVGKKKKDKIRKS